jgi:hypothetical protein
MHLKYFFLRFILFAFNVQLLKNSIVTLLLFSLIISCNEETFQNKSIVFESLNPIRAGIDFRNDLTYTEDFNIYLYKSFYNGSGVGLGDFNNDGLLDIFFSGNQVDNKCYLNKEDFKFKDITDISGLASPNVWSTGVSLVDINGDGWLDIYVCKAGKPGGENRHNELFINQGPREIDGIPTFIESAKEYGINDIGLSMHASFFDMDKDGDLDMYLLNNSIYPSEIVLDSRSGLRDKRDIDGGNKLYRNDGDIFIDISEQAGIYGSAIGFGLGVSIGDINRDSWPDIYISNDFFEKDYLYLNNRDGTFKEVLEEVMPEISQGAMGVDIADMNNDGYPEIFVTEMMPKNDARIKTKVLFDSWDKYKLKENRGYHRQFPRNTFQLNNGKSKNGTNVSFSEISRMSGVDATDWSWGVLMADFNNNGNKEIFVTNGIYKDLTDQDYLNFYSNSEEIRKSFREKGTVIKDLIDLMPSVPLVNPMYSHSENLQYQDVSKKWGIDQTGFSTGSAYGDLDNDGDLDLIVNNINMPPFLYKNNSSNNVKNHYINLSLISDTKNRYCIGSQVTLWAGKQKYFQELFPIRGSMSSVDNRLHFGLNEINHIDSLEIIWPNSDRLKLFNIKADQFLLINKSNYESTIVKNKNSPTEIGLSILTDITAQFKAKYLHIENDFVDFDRDKLLYHMISNEGPKLALGDVNKDGIEDFYIGGAKGHSGKLFLGDLSGQFIPLNTSVFETDKEAEDLDAVYEDIDNDGDLDLLVASGGYEFSDASLHLANRIYVNDGYGNFAKSSEVFPEKLGSTSCIALNDFDNDGDKDIFIGGRVVPLSYGIPASSYLLKNNGKGGFEDVTNLIAPKLQNLGMVTDAAWLDFDNDGDKDLFICGEWMPITVFRNDGESFSEVTEELGLMNTNGFWNSIEIADLDNDGDMDIVAGNIGLNTKLKASKEKPVSMYINDFDGNGKIDHIITTFEEDKAYPLATKDEITRQMPYLLKRYLKHHDFKEKTVEDIFTPDQLENSLKLNVFETASKFFINENGYFTSKDLPLRAQLSAIYGILIKDIDKDGFKDFIVGGNQFKAKPKIGVYAGSYGTLLRSLKGNEFEDVNLDESGLFVQGEIRDIKAMTFGNKEIILVARNDDSLKFYKINN